MTVPIIEYSMSVYIMQETLLRMSVLGEVLSSLVPLHEQRTRVRFPKYVYTHAVFYDCNNHL